MVEYVKTLLALRSDRKGVTALEYGLIAALIAVVIISALQLVGTTLRSTFNVIGSSI